MKIFKILTLLLQSIIEHWYITNFSFASVEDSPKVPTDSKTTYGIFKTKKSNYKMTPWNPRNKNKPQITKYKKTDLPKYAHWFQNNLRNFQDSKIKLKNGPLKSKNLKKAQNHKMSENLPPQICPFWIQKIIGRARRALPGGQRPPWRGRRPPALRRS